MALDKYEQEGLLFNINFKEKDGDTTAYRGELVLVEGEIADAQGRRKPPVAIVRQAVMLSKGDKVSMAAGFVDTLELLKAFVEKYSADFAEGMKSIFYVVNITKPMQIDFGSASITAIPLTDGMVWTEVVDELALEKSDFKGQSAAEKVNTLYEAFDDYSPKYDVVSAADADTFTADIKREARGPV